MKIPKICNCKKLSFLFCIIYIQCSPIQLKTLHDTTIIHATCEYVEMSGKPNSDIEQNLIRNHAKKSKTLLILTNAGTPDKFLTVYQAGIPGNRQFTLVFHFIDRYDRDLFRGELIMHLDRNRFIRQNIVQDGSSVVLGDVCDQHFFITLSESEFFSIVHSEVFNASIENVTISIPSICRKEWQKTFL